MTRYRMLFKSTCKNPKCQRFRSRINFSFLSHNAFLINILLYSKTYYNGTRKKNSVLYKCPSYIENLT